MTAADVLWVLDLLKSRGIEAWIGGGWGVDALVGSQTRDHLDLDVFFDRDQESDVVDLFAGKGFEETVDWRPGRFVLTDGIREVDLHPVEVFSDRSAVQRTHDGRRFDYPASALITGTIEGRTVPCIDAALQWAFHQGYVPTAKDRHDIALLEQLLGR
ncbi:MAG: amino acid transporter [Acidimicrobiia bacterium]|nr:amino acid transporter [Acidimicrobiia bacterium]NNF11268.1 amino acid transporter [Acidimicrobiia bacterium]NNL69003.1 amino acid transporter [Acidimicrobiia bacterium]